MTAFSVDTDALGALALRMARTRDTVARASRLVDDCLSGSSAGLVAAALADFDDHWRYGLRRIVDNLDHCHVALQDAATAYEQVEQAIAKAAGRG
jgi:uncharacterized protein YukE